MISDVYNTTAVENLPEETSFLLNTVTESFKVPAERAAEFINVFLEDLETAQLIEESNGKKRVLDITHTPSETSGVSSISTDDHLAKVSKKVTVEPSDMCFVIMPFANPIGSYYSTNL